jgi:hypothetical protein
LANHSIGILTQQTGLPFINIAPATRLSGWMIESTLHTITREFLKLTPQNSLFGEKYNCLQKVGDRREINTTSFTRFIERPRCSMMEDLLC